MHVQEVAQEVLGPQEVKMPCFCGLPTRIFKTQEAESLTGRSHKKLKI